MTGFRDGGRQEKVRALRLSKGRLDCPLRHPVEVTASEGSTEAKPSTLSERYIMQGTERT